MKILFACFFTLLITACSYKNIKLEENKDYTIKEVSSNLYLSFDEFIDKIYEYDIILLGEEHDKIKIHVAQNEILKALIQRKDYNVVFEMFDNNQQKAINKAESNKSNIKQDDLLKALTFNENWGKGYDLLLETTFYSNSNIIAGNLSKDEISTIYKGYELIKGENSTNEKVQSKIKELIASFHPNKTEENYLNKLVQIQQYKDRNMAKKLVEANNSSILIAGNFHTDKSVGVPLHIKDLKTDKKVVVIALVSNKKNEHEADFIWLVKK
ncbi:hypothetical protein FMM54_02185 [Campylobacter sp. LR185c]|uniref:ChaN family lipoprotein n=1 Tax=Campylobacter sp. LR185c TaxID=2014525 RepID=UPI0012381075|nr:ChaN family lipoprotein [Campylobacter sp. LR185c]KAA6227963.1 hypothetical protein FMM54_02185 [Campylobacter sp. LR185c]KAA8604348.1 hypothetical protein CGP82_02155 [Campylobacter sp. LR185c]